MPTAELQRWRQRNEAEIAAEQEFCFQQRLAGCDSLREIARRATEHFGYVISHETVRVRIGVECTERVEPLASQLKQVSISRAEAQLARLYAQLQRCFDAGAHPELFMKIEAQVHHTEDRLAKLNGTYAAVSVDVSVTHTGSIDDELQALSDRLGLGNGQVKQNSTGGLNA